MKTTILIMAMVLGLTSCGIGNDYNAQKNFCSITKYQANQKVLTATAAETIAKLKACWDASSECLKDCTDLKASCVGLNNRASMVCAQVGIPYENADMGKSDMN